MDKLYDILESWSNKDFRTNTNHEILKWIELRNKEVFVDIKQSRLSDSKFWFYDYETGYIKNKSGGFFSIIGINEFQNNNLILNQPIIIQDEIGFLGIITKKIDGVLQFLMQAKIEPGNINKIQLSPTIQATKSNFTQLHKGKKPQYLDYFLESEKYEIIVDQLQSEQSSRFYKKRNRNIIIYISENDFIEETINHKWMTLGQIKTLMHYDNIVNMDTRTVISCIPISFYNMDNVLKEKISTFFNNTFIYNSFFSKSKLNNNLFYNLNNNKMFDESIRYFTKIENLKDWEMTDECIKNKYKANFDVIFCEIEIDGREISKWSQPLFRAINIGIFGLFISVIEDKYKFLIRFTKEIGCFDIIELGPTIQMEPIKVNSSGEYNLIEQLFFKKLNSDKKNVIHDVMLSEEGGRFYHEQNRNLIIKIDKTEIETLPVDYQWLDYKQLNNLIQFNNILNIQLRNLLSLIEL